MNVNDCGSSCLFKVLGCIPCKSPDEIGKVLRVESRQLESGLLLEGVKQVLARLVSKGAKSPQDVGNVLRLALVSLEDISKQHWFEMSNVVVHADCKRLQQTNV